jgi:hypothetical protein
LAVASREVWTTDDLHQEVVVSTYLGTMGQERRGERSAGSGENGTLARGAAGGEAGAATGFWQE